jgi:excisionase family DNA binding protein
MSDQGRYFDTKAAAAYIAVTVKALQAMVFRRQIPFGKRGRRLQFDRVDLDAWIEGLKQHSVEDVLRSPITLKRPEAPTLLGKAAIHPQPFLRNPLKRRGRG